jgi:peroxin-16
VRLSRRARLLGLLNAHVPRGGSLSAVSALLGVLGVVNEHASTLDDTPCTAPATAPTAAPTVPWSLCVRVLHQLELLVEMSAQRAYGSDGKWLVLAALESGKAALRLAMLTRSGGCVLVGDVAPGSVSRTPGWALPGEQQGVRERAERTLRALAAFRDGRALSVRRLAPVLGCSPAVLRPQAAALLEVRRRRLLLAGEALRVLRPVVYCLAASRYGRRSWKPWLASLAMDLSRCVQHYPAPLRRALTRVLALAATLC